jgi:hypothetical protein
MKAKHNFSGITNIQDALTIASLDFTVNKTDLISNGITHETLSGLTSNSGLFLGIAGRNYNIIQNSEYFDFVNPLLKSNEVKIKDFYRFDSKVMLKLETTKKTIINPAINDVLQNYIYLVNDFSGKNANIGKFFTVRVACTNGMTRSNKEAEFKIKHFSSYPDKLKQAEIMLLESEIYNEVFQKQIETMMQRNTKKDELIDYINKVIGIDLTKANDEISTQLINTRKHVSQLYNSKPDIQPYKNTLFGGYLALTDYYSNHKTVKNSTNDYTVKDNSLVFDTLNNKLVLAYNEAMNILNN